VLLNVFFSGFLPLLLKTKFLKLHLFPSSGERAEISLICDRSVRTQNLAFFELLV
jgi:hypothetical protein